MTQTEISSLERRDAKVEVHLFKPKIAKIIYSKIVIEPNKRKKENNFGQNWYLNVFGLNENVGYFNTRN